MNSYRIIVQGCTPNVHLIPSGNANDQNKSISDLPFSVTESLRNPVTLSCSHSPSKFYWHPHSDQSIPWQGFLTSEDTKTKAYPCLKTIILVIACSWKSMDTIRYECPIMTLFLNALLTYRCTLQFLLLLQILAINFNHLTGCFMHSCTKHINSIRFKINWNNFKSYLIGSSSIRYTCNFIRFLSQVKLAYLTKSTCIQNISLG